MSEPSDDDLTMQIVADSFRVVSDSSAWDGLISAWDRKIERAGYDLKLLSGERSLKKQYSVLGKLLLQIGLPTAEDPIDRAVASVNEPAMVVSDKLRVVGINEAGRITFQVDQGRTARLDWLRDASHAEFREFLSGLVTAGNSNYRVFRTEEADHSAGCVEVYPVEVPGVDGKFIAIRQLQMQWLSAMDAILAQAFGLTQAEVDVARLLFLHADISRVAAARNVSIRTVRLQLSSIFAKTDTSSQVDLTRLLMLLSTRVSEKVANQPLKWADPFANETVLRRPDGRRLAWTWLGAPEGRPMLFIPGIVNGYQYPDEFEETLKLRGVKLIVMTRPGAGNSDRHRQLSSLDDHVESILYLCSALGLNGIAAAGIHAGVIPLSVIAARDDNPFSCLVAMGRFLLPNEAYFEKVARTPRTLLWLTFNAPWAADIIGRHAWRALLQHGVDWLIERAYRDMSFDYATAKRVEITGLLRNACAYTFLQGHEIFFDDMALRKIDVRDHLPRMKVPFHWLLGGVNVYRPSAPAEDFFDEDFVESFTTLSSLATFERIPNAGELMPYQQPRLLAERFSAAAFAAPTPRRM